MAIDLLFYTLQITFPISLCHIKLSNIASYLHNPTKVIALCKLLIVDSTYLYFQITLLKISGGYLNNPTDQQWTTSEMYVYIYWAHSIHLKITYLEFKDIFQPSDTEEIKTNTINVINRLNGDKKDCKLGSQRLCKAYFVAGI